MFSGNLLKGGMANLQTTETRVIDTNELVAHRLEEQEKKAISYENKTFLTALGEDAEGFQEGLSAETLEGVPGEDGESEGGPGSNVIKGSESREIIAMAKEQADKILEQTWSRAKEECDKLRAETQAQLVREREETLAQAREEGYSEGQLQAQRELEKEKQKLQAQLKQAEEEYQGLLDDMEPRFIESITGIYEHIFNVELGSYKDILVHLISTTMRKTEGTRDFLIHVSKEDYPYVKEQKQRIMEGTVASGSTVEIIEDITLAENGCMIETEGGIFDCGLGTQLTELCRKLRLLSYDK